HVAVLAADIPAVAQRPEGTSNNVQPRSGNPRRLQTGAEQQRLTLKRRKVGEQMKRDQPSDGMTISGNISNEPIRNPSAPTSVNRRETVPNAELANWGRTTLNRAEIMNPTQPRRLVKVTHQEMLSGCQAQWRWQVSMNAKYPEIRKRIDPTRSGAQMAKSCLYHDKSGSIASNVLTLNRSVPIN